MIDPRLFLCSGARVADGDARRTGRRVIPLDALGHDPSVHLRIEDVARVFLTHLTPRLVDLLEIAAYVYSADAGTSRGTAWEDGATEPWGRDFRFVVPVRDLAFWTRADVGDTLTRVLAFLSDDQYRFDFEALHADRERQEYIQFGDSMEEWPFTGVPRVVLFSGGLDSLAGAVQMASDGEPLVLVSHRPVSVLAKRQRDLVGGLRRAFPTAPLLHVPVWVNKVGRLGREATQRTRSFLFSALAVAVAESVRAEGVRFFENGVVSLNLPVADEVVGARASRTTHPKALHLFGALYSMVTDRPADRPFVVDNPYLHDTKAEVVERIMARGAGELIGLSVSCAHTIHKAKSQQHCGTCSQCIDRRVAVLAANAAAHDPALDYVVDVFTGPRKDGYERSMAVNYARHAKELEQMSEGEIAERFDRQLALATRFTSNRSAASAGLVALHHRHAAAVGRVLVGQLREHAADVVAGRLDKDSMLALVSGGAHLESVWRRYVDRIGGVLAEGVPIACQSERPKNEPHLQEIADGILAGHGLALQREYPFLRWGSVRTKPDWSAEEFGLWVELKYLRAAKDRVPVTEAIAADITKYGDNRRRVLFVVYDPDRHLADDAEFTNDITRHAGMFVRIIRA